MMRAVRRFFFAFVSLLALALPAPGSASECAPGEVVMSGGGCMPRGAVDCGTYYCHRGGTCVPPANCLYPPGTVRLRGAVCRPGAPPCPTGERCSPRGLCYDPKTAFVCGSIVCTKGHDYGPDHDCTICQRGGRVTPERKTSRGRIRGGCPNIVGTWNSWASGLFGRSDTTFSADGTARHRSGIPGKWWCSNGALYLTWGSQEGDYKITVSPDGSKIYDLNGKLVFTR